ncbi:hypothetical protein B0H10DRAFT_1969633 [Mycena sp. CBHHK59/15]|nr:hypothetical protein B0H10DRAFT_1969633 [Mycena sp. CBHHK59/15]
MSPSSPGLLASVWSVFIVLLPLRTKVEQSDHRNQLGLEKIEKWTKDCLNFHLRCTTLTPVLQVWAQIRSEHVQQGLYKPHQGRKNHKSTATLLSVPHYQDLLGDQNDEDPKEWGHMLVSSAEGWRTQVAKWIGDARKAERDNTDDEDNETIMPRVPNLLFGRAEKPQARKLSPWVMEEEEMMEQLADAVEDEYPDDSAIEIESDKEYQD